MKTYRVLVTVLGGRTIQVKAKSEAEAIKKVKDGNGTLHKSDIQTYEVEYAQEVA